jgi:group I intron endonuclease
MSDTANKIDNSGRFNTGHKHSEETRKQMSDTAKEIENPGRFSTGENHPNFGKNHSDETRKKISDAMSGENNPMFGKPKIEGSGKPSQSIKVFDLKENTTTTYDSIREAARALNFDESCIRKYFTNNQQKPYKGQYTFKKRN